MRDDDGRWSEGHGGGVTEEMEQAWEGKGGI